MKRFLLLTCIFAFLPIYSAHALQATSSMTVTVMVQGTFNLVVNTDSFDFERLAAGQTGEMNRSDGVAVTGSSTGGNPWYLKVSAAKPLTSGSNFIPNENFTWYGSSEGTGAWNGEEEKSLADAGNAAYISTPQEADQADKVLNRFNFRLHVPEDTRPGEYTTTVMFTMTE